mmetsp:Transcript_40059/g.73196  ORF Transcript_40059/g.73196 Transcript_40059/m.73196 type:complete len:169 (+) Transcript_40059:67-573(+)
MDLQEFLMRLQDSEPLTFLRSGASVHGCPNSSGKNCQGPDSATHRGYQMCLAGCGGDSFSSEHSCPGKVLSLLCFSSVLRPNRRLIFSTSFAIFCNPPFETSAGAVVGDGAGHSMSPVKSHLFANVYSPFMPPLVHFNWTPGRSLQDGFPLIEVAFNDNFCKLAQASR